MDKLPKAITNFEELEYRIPKFYEENKYRQYRYVDVKDIQILITPTNRLDELEEKYKKASPIFDYLDNKTEENYAKHAKFLEMLKVFKNLYNYRELLKTNVKKEIRGKYKNSFLGVLWSFLNPLLQIVVYAVVFQLILKNTKENYAIFICCGLIPWTFFSSAISN